MAGGCGGAAACTGSLRRRCLRCRYSGGIFRRRGGDAAGSVRSTDAGGGDFAVGRQHRQRARMRRLRCGCRRGGAGYRDLRRCNDWCRGLRVIVGRLGCSGRRGLRRRGDRARDRRRGRGSSRLRERCAAWYSPRQEIPIGDAGIHRAAGYCAGYRDRCAAACRRFGCFGYHGGWLGRRRYCCCGKGGIGAGDGGCRTGCRSGCRSSGVDRPGRRDGSECFG